MKKVIFALLIIPALSSCSSSDEMDMSDPLSSARGFIEASLLGDYIVAEKYMLKDSINDQYLDGLVDFSKKLSPMERQNYRTADIIIDSTKSVNDSTTLVFYRNTYKKEPTRLKLIKRDNEWRIDFKYTFDEEAEPQ